MNFFRYYGMFKKEFSILSRYRMLFVNRLLITPLISGITVVTVYAGFFRQNHGQSLGPLNSANCVPQLLLGILAHAFLNNGYYFLPAKINRELEEGTLPLLWINSCPYVLLIAGFVSVESVCCLVLAGLCLPVIAWFYPTTFAGLTIVILGFSLLFVFGIILGCFRAILYLLNEGLAEFLDHFYLGMVFLSCFYIPKELFPKFVWPLCEWNPGYHAVTAMRKGWFGEAGSVPHLFQFTVSLSVLVALLWMLWSAVSEEVVEHSF
jgi:ABC-type polysaccharide/polyol phosphate export permease